MGHTDVIRNLNSRLQTGVVKNKRIMYLASNCSMPINPLLCPHV